MAAKPSYILPQGGKNRAVLTLASGKLVALSDSGRGAVAQESDTRIFSNYGILSFCPLENTPAGRLAGFTLTTNAASRYGVELPDGSRVWLSAHSSLRFPATFTTGNRSVELLSGEAYFTIAPEAGQLFCVKTGNQLVTALGTDFNIRAYPGEDTVSTTLLQGRVMVSSGNGYTQPLQPGQQALVYNGRITVAPADTLQVTSWNKGLFAFDGVSMNTVMEQVARWYQVTIDCKNPAIRTRHLIGTYQRTLSLEALLKDITLAIGASYEIDNNRVILL